jgi:hypothetical protein
MGKAHVLILFSCHLAHVYFVCLHVHIDLTNAAFFFLSSGSTRLWCSLGGTERVSYRSPLDNPGCFGCILLFFFFLAGLGGSAHIETSAAPFRRERERTIDVHVICPWPASHPSPYPLPLTSAREKHRTAWNRPNPSVILTQSLSTQLDHRHPMARARCSVQLARAAVAGWLAGWLTGARSGASDYGS